MNGVIHLSMVQVVLSYIFVIFVLIILKIRGIKREKQLIVASIRMTLQLILVGYILLYVFENPNPFITIVIIVLMEIFAVFTVLRRFKGKLSKSMKKVIVFSMSFGTLSCIIYFLLVVIQIAPWYDPQYVIPIAGMVIGNSMTGISIGTNYLVESMTTRRAIVLEALILGATPKMAVHNIVNSAFDEAILPTINSMIGMGIVFLPGMMTGQILSGTIPTTAIAYQIAIMLGILGAVSVTVLMMVQLGYKTFFNKENQII